MKIISGNSNFEISKAISSYAKTALSDVNMTRFSDTDILF